MRVLLVEDDQFHASYMEDVLAETLPEVTEIFHAMNGEEAEHEARALTIDAVVMDLRMSRRNGIDAARTLWMERPETRILFWSNYADEAYLRGIATIVPEDSAYGYLLKTAPRDRLKLALRAVLVEGQIMVDREIHRLQRRAASPRNTLDDSEFAVLLDLAIGLQDRIIAERRGMSLRTVQNRLLSLYEKLGVDDEASDAMPLNKRVRALNRALVTRTLNIETLETAQRDFDRWQSTRKRA
ncbi:response regulator transcription factor [Sagittula stellata]|uniref:Putative two-component response regulator n=1 Tax=Sagittula stellata (strain ATCC 700073 / DSM 11524 / E-37) TaxID=388399 RepID=A3K7L3_SAGS3|nr:response regulator transcription factor [Sagittula stellata]EBA06972.1 putative two-component response regulator [Sagittula stellata E-37]